MIQLNPTGVHVEPLAISLGGNEGITWQQLHNAVVGTEWKSSNGKYRAHVIMRKNNDVIVMLSSNGSEVVHSFSLLA